MWYSCLRVSALSFLAAVALADFAAATPAPRWRKTQIKHRWEEVPRDWESLGPPSPSTAFDLHIALRPDREGALTDALLEVSDPNHSRYGAFLSKEDVAELVKPSQDTLDAVCAWLADFGISPSSVATSHGGDWLTVSDVLVPQANELLGASYLLYRNVKTNETIIRTISYSLPAELHLCIDVLVPTTLFASAQLMSEIPSGRPFRAAPAAATSGSLITALSNRANDPVPNPAQGQRLVTPSFLRWLYKTDAFVPVPNNFPNTETLFVVVGMSNQFMNPMDLNSFLATYRSDAKVANIPVLQLNGAVFDSNNPSPDGSIAIQYSTAFSYPIVPAFYSVAGGIVKSPSGEPLLKDALLTLLGYLIDQQNPPHTVSISYVISDETSVPQEYAERLCAMFEQAGARGITILVASGFSGVGAGECSTDDTGFIQFVASFPGTCPYVTTVGGTTSSGPEKAAKFGGGGFSKYFPRPPYQDNTVPGYVQQLGRTYAGSYNPKGRGYPDISAQALSYVIYLNGKRALVSGTTCSVTTAAGIFALINTYRIEQNNAPLGMANIWLYGTGRRGLTDILTGSNFGCAGDGFYAVEGWDAATGLGTPHLGELLRNLILNNQDLAGPSNQAGPSRPS